MGVLRVGLLIALVVGRPLRAQKRATKELGVSALYFPDDDNGVLAPSIRSWLTSESAQLTSRASIAGFAASGAAGGSLDLSSDWRHPLGNHWLSDASGELSGVTSTESGSASSALVSVGFLFPLGQAGVGAHANGSASHREAGALWGRGVEMNGWWQEPHALFTASARRQWSMAQLFLGPGRTRLVGTVPVHFAEGSAGVQVEQGATAVSFAVTVRHDPGATHTTEAGFSASAMYWMTESVALVASGGKQLPDFERGADAVQSFTLGIRINEPTPAARFAERVRPIIQVADDSVGRTLRVRAAGARKVEVMGDFTDWETIELAPRGGVFSRAVKLSSGTHKVLVRLDDGPWLPAANTPAVDDDLGGRVGLLLIP